MKKTSRIISILLTLCMLIGMLPMSVFAADVEQHSQPANAVELHVGEQKTLQVNASFGRTTWSTSNDQVASVTNDGTVTAVREGTATVSAVTKYFWGTSKTSAFTIVVVPAAGLSVKVGETLPLQVEADGGEVSWTSAAPDIASVSDTGLVTGVKEGSVTITATIRKTVHSWFFWRPARVVTSTKNFNVTVTAADSKPLPVIYTVTFEANGGSAVEPQQVEAGKTAMEPAIPTRDNYEFAGWYTDTAFTNRYDFQTPVTADVTLYAKWEGIPEEYSVVFESNGGTVVFTQFVAEGQTVQKPEDPIKSGCTFAGWYTDAELTNAYDFAAPVTQNMTLYAKWEGPSAGTFTVTFESNGGSEVEEQQVKQGTQAAVPENPVKSSCYFNGWYVDAELKELYDFELPVERNLTLYAGWDESAIDPEEYEQDTDNDGISDGLEEELGMDPAKSDTDEDGLSDQLEVQIGYDPTNPDTDGDGVKDLDDDADGDGLSNATELELGTALDRPDTDGDWLTDAEEVNTYKTNPLIYDTDTDGVFDGYEVELGTDPLVFEDSFHITETAEEEDRVKVSVDIDLEGPQVETLEVEAVDNETLFPEDMPGYMGMAYDFSVEGTFSSATIQFAFDPALLSQGADPAIFYFNETNQTLEELATTVENGVASAKVEHFSTYVLIDRTLYYNAYGDLVYWTDVWDSEGEFNRVEVVLVIDDSGSMSSNDSNNQRLEVAKNLVDKLPADSKIGVISFESDVCVLTPQLTTDREAAKAFFTETYFQSSGGTYMYTAINDALNLFSQPTDGKTLQMMVVLSDGDAHDSSKHNSMIQSANEKGVRIYTVGLGNSTSYFNNYLKPLATETNGSFYLASNADELTKIYEDINKKIDIETDTDGDSIPDYYEDHMVGFNNMNIKLDKNNPDSDGDGLKDGEELEIVLEYNADKTKVRIKGKYLSNPALEDSDYDGINDNEESPVNRMNNEITAKAYYSVAETLLDDALKTENHYDAEVHFRVDYRKFFKDNYEYQKDLAVLGSLYVLDMYSGPYLDFTGYPGANGKGTTKDLDNYHDQDADKVANLGGQGVSFQRTFGLQDVRNYNAKSLLTESSDSALDPDDVTEFTIGHRNVTYKGENREIIVMALRGTNGTNAEWSSNFDVGANTQNYFRMTGDHPDWNNYNNHKGFDVAANRVMKCYEHYMKLTGLDQSQTPKSLFIVGHSRAAAVANILGSMFDGKPGYTVYVYAYATPATTTQSNAENTHRCIFNLVNTDDLVTYLPLKDWGFKRYGVTKTISVKEKYESNWVLSLNRYPHNSFEDMFGRDYNSNGQLEAVLKKFRKFNVKDRADLYEMDTSSDGTVWATNMPHFSYAKAQEEMNILEKSFTEEKLMKFCNMFIDKSAVGTSYVAYTYCPAFFTQTLANMTVKPAEGAPTLGRDVKGIYREAKSQFVMASGKIWFGGIANPHMPTTYYLIATNDFKDIK